MTAGDLSAQFPLSTPFDSGSSHDTFDTSAPFLDGFARELLNEASLASGLDGDLFKGLPQPAFHTPPEDYGFSPGVEAQASLMPAFPPIPAAQSGAAAAAPLGVGFGLQLQQAPATPPLLQRNSDSFGSSGGPVPAGAGGGTTPRGGGGGGRRQQRSSTSRQTSSGSDGADPDFVPEHQVQRRVPANGTDGLDKVSKQLNKFKEKNRTAQKRYRERQKSKLQESEEKVQELSEQLRMLTTEKESLASRNSLLERFLAMQQQQAAAGTATLVEHEGSAWWLDTHTRRLVEETLNLTGILTFTVRTGTPVRLTREQVANLPMDEFTALWKEYISAYADCLVKADGDPASPAGKRLARLVFEAGQIKACVGLTFPDRIHSFHIKHTQPQRAGDAGGGSAADGAAPPADPQELATWKELLAQITLTADQRRVLICLRRMFLTNLGVLVARRRALSSRLQASLPGGERHAAVGTEYLQSVAIMDKLRETLRDEHSFLVQFMVTVWRRCLTPFQSAHLHIHSYPRAPDLLALINCLAEQEGEPSYSELLCAGAKNGDGTALLPLDAAVGLLPASLKDFGIKHVEFDTRDCDAVGPPAVPRIS